MERAVRPAGREGRRPPAGSRGPGRGGRPDGEAGSRRGCRAPGKRRRGNDGSRRPARAVDFAASPAGKLRLQLGKLGSELARIGHARKLSQLPLVDLRVEIGSHFEENLRDLPPILPQAVRLDPSGSACRPGAALLARWYPWNWPFSIGGPRKPGRCPRRYSGSSKPREFTRRRSPRSSCSPRPPYRKRSRPSWPGGWPGISRRRNASRSCGSRRAEAHRTGEDIPQSVISVSRAAAWLRAASRVWPFSSRTLISWVWVRTASNSKEPFTGTPESKLELTTKCSRLAPRER